MRGIGIILLLAGGLWLSAGETVVYRSPSGVSMKYTSSLRRLEGFLKDIFHKTYYRKNPLTIRINGKYPISGGDDQGNVVSVSTFDIDNGDLETISRVGGAILNAWGKAPAGFKLPLFLAASFRYKERSAQQQCRFLGNNRRLNCVEVLLRNDVMPDLKTLLAIKSDEKDHAHRVWYDDHARVVFEMLRRTGFRGSPEQIFSAAEKVAGKNYSLDDFYPFIWNNFNLMPPHLIRRKLDAVLQCSIPKLDHENMPTSLSENVQAAGIPAKLRKHPMRKEILSGFAEKILAEAADLPIYMRHPMRQLHDAARRLGSDPEQEKRFLEALKKLEQDLQFSAGRTGFLDKCTLNDLQPLKSHLSALKANAGRGGILAPECQRYLDRCEEYFGRF